MLAIETFETAFRAPDERLGQYAFLKRLPAGLRAEVWLGLPAGGSSLGQLVAIKMFCPHAPGAARTALAEELAFAARLGHPNIAQPLKVGWGAERQYIVSEYLEGTTLRALLRRVSVARAGMGAAAVACVLLGIVHAVCHAERRVSSPAERTLVDQTIAADDVFVTFDGAVKLLGFKSRAMGAESRIRDGEAWRGDSSAYAAIDALLSEHLTPELGAVLAAGNGSRARGVHGLQRVGRALRRWQAEVLGSNGRAELAALMGAMFPGARVAQRAQLELRFEQWLSRRPGGIPLAEEGDEHAPPASGFRRILP